MTCKVYVAVVLCSDNVLKWSNAGLGTVHDNRDRVVSSEDVTSLFIVAE